jgi:uncharacterized protein YjiS (DUF1127 family)
MSAARQESGRRPKIGAWPGFLARVARALSRAAATRAWLERRRTRRHLTRLSDHMLRDIGISRGDVVQEAQKPFWRK